MVNVGATYCYDVGKYNTGTANNVFKCASNSDDCCSCMFDDSFDANAANCPAASDCTAFCASNDETFSKKMLDRDCLHCFYLKKRMVKHFSRKPSQPVKNPPRGAQA